MAFPIAGAAMSRNSLNYCVWAAVCFPLSFHCEHVSFQLCPRSHLHFPYQSHVSISIVANISTSPQISFVPRVRHSTLLSQLWLSQAGTMEWTHTHSHLYSCLCGAFTLTSIHLCTLTQALPNLSFHLKIKVWGPKFCPHKDGQTPHSTWNFQFGIPHM